MTTGTVKFYNDTKGFGFITPDDGSEDIFVHITGVIGVDSLLDNDKVKFDAIKGRQGKYQAVNVTLIHDTQNDIIAKSKHDSQSDKMTKLNYG